MHIITFSNEKVKGGEKEIIFSKNVGKNLKMKCKSSNICLDVLHMGVTVQDKNVDVAICSTRKGKKEG